MSDDREGPEQGALFRIRGPDGSGCVSLCEAAGCERWSRPLGEAGPVAEVLKTWLAARGSRGGSGVVAGAGFQIEGADDDGCVWACSPSGGDTWCLNLGPEGPAAEAMKRWLDEQ